MNKKTSCGFREIIRLLAWIMVIIGGTTIVKILIVTPILSLLTAGLLLYERNGSVSLLEIVPSFINWWGVSICLFGFGLFLLIFVKKSNKNKVKEVEDGK